MTPAKPRILLIEDEISMASILMEIFAKEQFEARHETDGQSGADAFFSFAPDLCIVDIMLPVLDGYSVVQRIRQSDKSVPIILLTAKTQTADVVKGFSYGVNDYVRKPFSVDELLARVQAHLAHRGTGMAQNDLQISRYRFNSVTQQLTNGEKDIYLTGKENELLLYMTRHMNELMLKSDILLHVWGHDDFFNSRTLDVYMSKIRKYLSDDPGINILSIRGYGYKFICTPS